MTARADLRAAGRPSRGFVAHGAGRPVLAAYGPQIGPGGDVAVAGAGFGGLLSTLTFGLIKSKPKAPPPPSQDQTIGEVAGLVVQQLQAQGMTAPAVKVRESVGYNLNALSAWSGVYSDVSGLTTQMVVGQVINDLISSGLVTRPGTGALVTPGAPGAPPVTAPALVSGLDSRALLLAGGVLAAGLVLGGRRRRGRR